MRVFEWLGSDSKGVPYYLHPLNLVWSDEGFEHDLQVYRRVAGLLAADRVYWSQIIREANWRHSLVGCVCLLAAPRQDFFDDLCFRFRASSFIAPQIAITLGLLHRAQAPAFFTSVLEDAALRQKPKIAVGAHRVLLRLGVQPAHEVSLDDWRAIDRDDAFVADAVVREHWNFWSGRV